MMGDFPQIQAGQQISKARQRPLTFAPNEFSHGVTKNTEQLEKATQGGATVPVALSPRPPTPPASPTSSSLLSVFA